MPIEFSLVGQQHNPPNKLRPVGPTLKLGGNMIDFSIWHIFIHASIIVKGVMLLLLAASIASWTVIVQRALVLKEARKRAEVFEERFWSGANINQLYQVGCLLYQVWLAD